MPNARPDIRELLPDDQPISALIKTRIDEAVADVGGMLGGGIAVQSAIIRETLLGLVELERRVMALEQTSGESPGAAA